MAFASWYSIRKRLPDCEVWLRLSLSAPLFGWANRMGVRISRSPKCSLEIPCTVVMVRDFGGSEEISPARSQNQTSFVDYSGGCGNFVVDEWIHTAKVPLQRALIRFGSFKDLTVNERAVLTVWEQCYELYRTAGGS
jgi:hypothetical protein